MIRGDEGTSETNEVENVAQLRKYLRGRIGGDHNFLMWKGTYDPSTVGYIPDNQLKDKEIIAMKEHGEDGWISNTEALVIEITPFTLYFRINGRDKIGRAHV